MESKKIVVIGSSGTGKSSFCNTLCDDKSKKKYSENNCFESCSNSIRLEKVKWSEDHEEFTLIDTPGIGDSTTDSCAPEWMEILGKAGQVQAFVLVFNGQIPRFDENMKFLITSLSKTFGSGFLKNTILVFTRWSFDEKMIKMRLLTGSSEATYAKEYNDKINSLLGTTIDIKCCFIDNNYNTQALQDCFSDDELQKFQNQLESFRKVIESLQPFKYTSVEDAQKVSKELHAANSGLKVHSPLLTEERLKSQEKEISEIKIRYDQMFQDQKNEINQMKEQSRTFQANVHQVLIKVQEMQRMVGSKALTDNVDLDSVRCYFRCLGHIQNKNKYLSVWNEQVVFSSDKLKCAQWVVVRLGEDKYALQSCLDFELDGNSTVRYLDGDTGSGFIRLRPHIQYPWTGTHWKLESLGNDEYNIRCLGHDYNPKHQYIDGNTGDGRIQFAPHAEPPFTGTRWKLERE